jgi:hypothetical protein
MSAIGPERYRTRVPFRCVMEGVRIDEDTALKAAAGLTCRGCDSHSFRHFRCCTGSLCFRPTLVSRNSSSGYISSRIWLSSAVSAVGHGGQGNTDRPNPHDISPSQRPFSKFGNSKLECGSVSYSGPRLTGYKHSKCARGPGTDAAAKCNCSRAV